ncbi:MAG: hypothetical protein ACI8UO_000465 [Verrucomicrobiales bacterium]|jgi:hypothetical protein
MKTVRFFIPAATLVFCALSSCSWLGSDVDRRLGAFGPRRAAGNQTQHFANIDLEPALSFSTYTPYLPSYPSDPSSWGNGAHPSGSANQIPISLIGESHYDFGVVTFGDQVVIADTYGAVFHDGRYAGSVTNFGVANEPMLTTTRAMTHDFYLGDDWLLTEAPDSEAKNENQ